MSITREIFVFSVPTRRFYNAARDSSAVAPKPQGPRRGVQQTPPSRFQTFRNGDAAA